jgi:hypothetical protein
LFAAGLFDQQRRYRAPDVPAVVSDPATAYTSLSVDAVTDFVDDNPTYVLTPRTLAPPHANADSKMRIAFVARRPTPVNCSEHVSVSVHCVAPTNGPETWKGPTEKEKLASCAQHK